MVDFGGPSITLVKEEVELGVALGAVLGILITIQARSLAQ